MKKILTIIITLSLLLSSSVVSLYAVTITNNSSSNTSSSSPLTGTNGNISADDNAELVPEISYEYVDFGASVDKNAEYADDSIIVTMKRGVKEANHVYTAKDFPELDVDHIEDLTYLTNEDLLNDPEFMANYTQILQIHLKSSSEEKVLSSVGTLSKRSTTDVASASPNYKMEVIPETEEGFELPNDPHYSDQEEYFERINLPQAWEKIHEERITPTTVKVAVIDTGVEYHTDLNVSTGYDFENDENITNDSSNIHGTKVAGVLGAIAQNNQGIAGVCWNVTIIPLQFDHNDDADFISTMTYLNNNNIALANVSLGLLVTNLPSARVAINNYFGLLVMSGGNTGADNTGSNRVSSLDCNNIITVMGTDKKNQMNELNETVEIETRHVRTPTSTSNYSKTDVDIAAPWYAYTTCYDDTLETPSYYGSAGGTSMSAPYVAGVAAMLKSIAPYLSTYDIKEILMNSVEPYDNLTNECVSGGFLNAEAAVNMALSYKKRKPQTFTVDVNFDGYDDLVYLREYAGKRHIQVFLGNGQYIIGTPATYPSSVDTTRCSVDTFTTDTFKASDIAFMGDINRDHCMDMIVHSSNGYRIFYVYLGQPNGKFSNAVITATPNQHSTSLYPCKIFSGDFNGDLRCDILVHYKNDDGKRANLVYAGTDSGVFSTGINTNFTEDYIKEYPVFIVDINNDGKDDVVVHSVSEGYRQFLIYRSGNNCSFLTFVNVDANNQYSSAFPSKFLVGDFNGDGYGDFYVWWRNNQGLGNHIIYPGKPNGQFDTNTISITTSLNYYENQKLFVGDVNDDGIDDVIMHWPDSSTNQLRLRVCFVDTTSTPVEVQTYDTVSTSVITGGDMVYRVHVGDFNGSGTDIITEIASSDFAYRSTALVNRGYSTGFESMTIRRKLRTYFYIDYQ